MAPPGAAGTLFEVTASRHDSTVCWPSAARRRLPHATLLAHPDGSLYGVSAGGGSMSAGTIFRLVPGVSFQVLHEFNGPRTAPGAYDALSRASDGSLYGTAPGGGASMAGTIYKLSSAGTFSLLNPPPTTGTASIHTPAPCKRKTGRFTV